MTKVQLPIGVTSTPPVNPIGWYGVRQPIKIITHAALHIPPDYNGLALRFNPPHSAARCCDRFGLFRIDDWLLYVVDSPSASGARGLVRDQLFDRAGRLVVSIAQEGLIHRRTSNVP